MQTLKHFRVVSMLEGISYLLLLFVAMPLKYMAGLPMATKVAGSVHGILFVTFVLALYRVVLEHGWPARRSAAAVVACLTPFGAFVFDRALKRELDAQAVPALAER